MQIMIDGIIAGLTLALLALSFAVVYLPTGIFHLGVGGVYAVAPFIAWTCLQWGWSWYLAVFAALLTGVLLSLIIEVINHAPLERKKASSTAHLISSLGIYLIIVQAIALVWGNDLKVLRRGVDYTWSVAGIILSYSQILAGISSIFLLVLFFFGLRFSKLGLQFRALADNPSELAIRGYNVRYLRLLAFGMSGLLSVSSSLLVAQDIGFDFQVGLPAVLLAIVAVIVGGKESFSGAVLGGVLIAVLRSEVVWFLSARWQGALTFFLLAVFLLARPTGLLGQKRRLEAAI